ncbi:class I SAM-dependent methyltransferase [candidate division KSB1 bacterium]
MSEEVKIHIEEKWVSEKNDWNSKEEYLLFLKQKKAYHIAKDYCGGKKVLDYSCGSGYGTSLISKKADIIFGVDIDEEVIAYCKMKYIGHNITFQKIKKNNIIPFEDQYFDVIVSFQVIEHIPDVNKYLSEFKRVLKDNGSVFISTPNKKYRLLPFQKPWNLEHLREYDVNSFKKEIQSVFKNVNIMGISGTKEINEIEYNRVRQSPIRVYLISPMKKLLPDIIIKILLEMKKLFKKNITANPNENDFLTKYNINDFTVAENPDSCLDLLAICKKD